MVPQGAELGAYTGTGFALVDSDTNVTFDLSSLPRDSQYQLILRISYVVSLVRYFFFGESLIW